MERESSGSGSDYFDCATDRSRSSSEEGDDRVGRSGEDHGRGRDERVRRFRPTESSVGRDSHRGGETDAESTSNRDRPETGDGFEICGYELQAPRGAHGVRRLSMDATLERHEFLRAMEVKSQSVRSKVQDEVMKVLFGPSDAKTPDGENYEIVEQEEVVRGVGHTGILFRFSMWATLGFITLVLGGGRARVGCSEFFPNVTERDPVPKVIARRQAQSP